MRRSVMRTACASLFEATALLALLSAGCSEDKRTKPILPNEPPVVEITTGAADSTATSYITTFGWHGADSDGAIDHYLYAVDDSSAGWTETTETSVELHLTAPDPDPEDPAGAHGWHSFWVLAVDDDGARSAPDGRAFNARTIAPTSRIVSPRYEGITTPQLFQGAPIRWDGEDLDGTQSNHRPIAWEIKLVRIGDLFDSNPSMEDSLLHGANLLVASGSEDPTEWLRQPASIRSVELDPELAAATLAFGVRALDEAGATEPALARDRNFIAFVVNPGHCQPFVTVRAPSGASHIFPIDPPDNEIWNITIPCGAPIQFNWSIDASYCGLEPGESAFSWDNGPLSEWAIRSGSGEPVIFPCEDGPMTHTFWLRARPAGGGPESERTCRVNVSLVDFPRDRFALWVDDARLGRNPSDADHDRFLQETALAAFHARGEVDRFSMFGSSTDENRASSPNELPFETLAHYQNVIWSIHLGANTQTTGLYKTERMDRHLSNYLSAGGRLLLIGGGIAGQLSGGRMGHFGYPKPLDPNDGSGQSYDRDSFLWRFLHFRGPIMSIPTSTSASAEQRSASGLVAARALDPAYPDLALDPEKWSPDELLNCNEGPEHCFYRGGIGGWEGFQRMEGEEVGAGFDSLYAATTFDRYWDPLENEGYEVESESRNAILAHRYEATAADTVLGLAQGRVMVFGFEPWYFEREGLIGAGSAAAAWLVTGSR